MKSVVVGVIVQWSSVAEASQTGWYVPPGFDRDAKYACQLIEKYPGDSRWRCGICSRGQVRPTGGSFCDTCSAYVCQVIRDEDEEARKWRDDQRQFASVQEWEDEFRKALNKKQAGDGRIILRNIDAGDTIEPPQKQLPKPLQSPGPRKIEIGD